MDAISDQVRGKTIRLIWTNGPVSNTAQDHVFHKDGTVEWQSAGKDAKRRPASAGRHGAAPEPHTPPDRPHYAGMKVTDEICLVSYLSESGYTLTIALNFSDGSTVGVASNEGNWIPVAGKFEVLKGGKPAFSGQKVFYAGGTAYVTREH